MQMLFSVPGIPFFLKGCVSLSCEGYFFQNPDEAG